MCGPTPKTEFSRLCQVTTQLSVGAILYLITPTLVHIVSIWYRSSLFVMNDPYLCMWYRIVTFERIIVTSGAHHYYIVLVPIV